MGERVLVTGGTGFVGSHLIRRLLARGDEVHALVRKTSSRRRLEGVEAKVTFWQGDLGDADSLGALFAAARPALVFHLAASTGARRPQAGWSDVWTVANIDLLGTLRLIEAAAKASAPPRLFIRTGTLAEYGNQPPPHAETVREEALNAYTAGLVSAAHFAQSLKSRVPFELISLRLGMMYGPHQSDDFYVPQVINACLRNEPIRIRTGYARRDFLYVGDAVEGILRASEAKGLSGQIINIGSGAAPSVIELAETVKRVARSSSSIEVEMLADSASMNTMWGNPEKAACLLGWRAPTSLEEGLKVTIPWYREQLGEKRP